MRWHLLNMYYYYDDDNDDIMIMFELLIMIGGFINKNYQEH